MIIRNTIKIKDIQVIMSIIMAFFCCKMYAQVGIGTDNPQDPLHILSLDMPQFNISNTLTDFATFSVNNEGRLTISTTHASGSNGHIILNPDGRVGIFEQNPQFPVHINTSFTDVAVEIENTNANAWGLRVETPANTNIQDNIFEANSNNVARFEVKCNGFVNIGRAGDPTGMLEILEQQAGVNNMFCISHNAGIAGRILTVRGNNGGTNSYFVGIGTENPTALLDVTGDGAILFPRRMIIGDPAGIDGMIYYNDFDNVFRAFQNGAWINLIGGGGGGWLLTGNNGTDPLTNFLGTIDNQGLSLRTNNTNRIRILPDGNVGIGDITPAALFTVGDGDLFQVQSTGEAQGVNGSAGTPSFSFANDNNNGMYLSGADQLSFSTNGTERVRILNNGWVGFGDAATLPPNSPLHVEDDRAGNPILHIRNTSLSGWGVRISCNGSGDNENALEIQTGGGKLEFRNDGQMCIGDPAMNPNVRMDIGGAIALRPDIIETINSDGYSLTVGDMSYIRLASDDATATNRTFSLSNGLQAGQILMLEWTDAINQGELQDFGNCNLSTTWPPANNQEDDTITLIWNGTNWVELSRSAN